MSHTTPNPPRPSSRTLRYKIDPNTHRNQDISSIIFNTTQTYHTKCIPTGEHVIIGLADEKDMDAHTTPTITQKLRDLGIHLVESPAMQSAKTILALKIDTYLLQRNTDNLKTEIEQKNNIKIEDIRTIPKAHMIKIRLCSNKDAKTLQEKGIKVFSQIIPHYNIIQQQHQEVRQCYKCLQYDHKTNECKKDTDICSNCAQTGHTYKTCTSNNTTCYNCQGNHAAVAFKCPVKKQALNMQNKSPPTQAPQTHSYAQATATPTMAPSLTPTPHHTQHSQTVLHDTQIKIMTISTAASELAKGDAALYIKIYNNLLVENNLPKIKISQNILNLVSAPQANLDHLSPSGPHLPDPSGHPGIQAPQAFQAPQAYQAPQAFQAAMTPQANLATQASPAPQAISTSTLASQATSTPQTFPNPPQTLSHVSRDPRLQKRHTTPTRARREHDTSPSPTYSPLTPHKTVNKTSKHDYSHAT